jgi:hypothetical protein
MLWRSRSKEEAVSTDQAIAKSDKPAQEQSATRSRRGPGLGLDDPKAIDILTAEHWSLLSTRTLGSTEIFARASIFAALLSGMVIALSFLAQATKFGSETAIVALVLVPVILFIGVTTFIRSVAINQEDSRWVTGMSLIRHAYLQINPELERYFVADHGDRPAPRALGHGRQQRLRHLARSLTTTSGVVAALDSILAGAIASILAGLITRDGIVSIVAGSAISLVAAAAHVAYAARSRESHAPTQTH